MKIKDIARISAKLDAFAELAYKAKSAEAAARQNLPYPIDERGPRKRLQEAKDALLQSFSAGMVIDPKEDVEPDWVYQEQTHLPSIWTAMMGGFLLSVSEDVAVSWSVTGPYRLELAEGRVGADDPGFMPDAKPARTERVVLARERCARIARILLAQSTKDHGDGNGAAATGHETSGEPT